MTNLLHRIPDLDKQEEPFKKKEIHEVVKNMPSEKALGPDGFNGGIP